MDLCWNSGMIIFKSELEEIFKIWYIICRFKIFCNKKSMLQSFLVIWLEVYFSMKQLKNAPVAHLLGLRIKPKTSQ